MDKDIKVSQWDDGSRPEDEPQFNSLELDQDEDEATASDVHVNTHC